MPDRVEMVEVNAVPRTLMLWVVPVLLIAGAACGGGSDAAVSNEPVSARVIVTDVQVSADDQRVEYITVLTDDGEEITMRLSGDIEPAAWDPSHLLSHAALGRTLGLKIEVTYVRADGSVTVTKLSE